MFSTKIFNFNKLLCLFVQFIFVTCFLFGVESNDSVELRHVQIVFRHGDRAPLVPMFPNDPFQNESLYWPNGLEQLTNLGRVRMFRLGQMLRARYNNYLGDRFSPREVYARSSAIDRCLESAQLVLAGAYPPNSSFSRWDINSFPLPLGRLWQPIPISSFIPPNDDGLLRVEKICPKADIIRKKLMTTQENLLLIQNNKTLLDELSNVSGYKIDSILSAAKFHEMMNIEHENGYFWYNSTGTKSQNWTEEYEQQVIQTMRHFDVARWNSEFNDTFIKRVRAGELLSEIGENFVTKKSVQSVQSDYKRLVLFSTHDSKLSALLHTLDVWNEALVPYSAAIMFELYQSVLNQTNFYVQVWYYNETKQLLTSSNFSNQTQFEPYLLQLPNCTHVAINDSQVMCPLDQFLNIVEKYKPPANWNEECEIESEYTNLLFVNIILLIFNLLVMFMLLMLVMYNFNKINSRQPGYQQLQ